MRARLCVALAVLFALWVLSPQSAAAAGTLDEAMQSFGVQIPSEHKPAPDFSLSMAGSGTDTLKNHHGRLVLLHFWATWCVPCRKEMPLLHHLDRELSAKGLSIVCVNVDRGDEQKVHDFMQEVSPRFHTLLDPEGVVRNRYEVRALPTSYLIGGDGKIIGRFIGERGWDGEESLSLFRQLVAAYAKP
ncbi:MAG: hypothetical protein COW19_02615 [Zetaproteobacteria bacterium CG12_big_fil_rev_8_21_14_0_65_55_1124]|nr:MAG: hypothetical protein AUJ58_08410 [Zetaproteobacteria bacterium CG1_02_55_237]PIS19714.1 MAG: hypothetical protein COT53_04120 [Zetaproteobacteria bacterium CG08_land_8_20_14_0_20_55_17]PIW43480.1 MAG: hypothetical protein COW19_02615 [Zetaproteobacteria bacterium CG12_big_fil_rev_8_21_14_0_65_55_1124]PIY54112.1 MAG: hypothetical protein COZ01_01395 [Zetaproteobacteria bacterium CG_4_10_14_0_8_um_filter_55_43]PIZ39105.1 MAG: hypothetical protein COY36_03875 [Zetaproteobacteria bacterium 